MSDNKYKNNHFIQKAFVKNFANNDIVKYMQYPNGNEKEFNINKNEKEHPIAEKEFYNAEVEKSLGLLESDGILVINKIIEGVKNNKVILNSKQLISLSFFVIMTDEKMYLSRTLIENLKGDSLFNNLIKTLMSKKMTSKEIQEYKLTFITNLYLKVKNQVNFDLFNKLLKYNETDAEYFLLKNIIEFIYCAELHIFKFDKKNLLLTQAPLFCESTKDFEERDKKNLYYFMAISPDIGIMFDFRKSLYSTNQKYNLNKKMCESEIFNNEKLDKENKIKYINNKLKKYMRDKEQHIDEEFEIIFKHKHRNSKDLYFYDIIYEEIKTSEFCNAMQLVHNYKNIIIYQNINDIKKADELIKKYGIYRIEETR